MKKKTVLKSTTVAFGLLALSSLPAAAIEKEDYDFLTTKHLYNLCSATAVLGDYPTASYACRGFIEGAIQYHDGVSDAKHLNRLICYPEGTTLKDGRVAFVNWVDVHMGDKALMNELPVKGLVRALADAYPCKE